MKFSFEHNAQNFPIDLTPAGDGKTFRATIGEKTVDVELLQAKDGKLELLIDGKRLTACISSDKDKRWVTIDGQTFVLTKSTGARRRGQAGQHAAGALTAPMPGQVRAVNVREGDPVTKGQTLVVLEAMKMEIRIHAPQDGVVKKLFVQTAQTVEREQILIELEEN